MVKINQTISTNGHITTRLNSMKIKKKSTWSIIRPSESLQKFLLVFICENIRYDAFEETDDFTWEKSNIWSILD